MNAQLVVMADRDLMLDRVLKITLDVNIGRLARLHPTHCADLHQHTLELEQVLPIEDSLAAACLDPVQFTHREFMPQFGKAPFTDLLRGGVDQLERHKDLRYNALFHLTDAVKDACFTDREWGQTLRVVRTLQNGI